MTIYAPEIDHLYVKRPGIPESQWPNIQGKSMTVGGEELIDTRKVEGCDECNHTGKIETRRETGTLTIKYCKCRS